MITGLLLSGGMDSVALAYWKRPTHAYTVDYGQAAFQGEYRAAAAIAKALGIEHHSIHADCSSLGSGDMSGKVASKHAPVSEWWPYRNQLVVTLTAMRALDDGIEELMVGSVRSDSSHVDGTPEFYA